MELKLLNRYKKSYVITSLSNELEFNLDKKRGNYKKRMEELTEDIDVFYIVANNKGINDYKEVILNSDKDSILLLTYAEYEKLISIKSLSNIIKTKIVIDLRN